MARAKTNLRSALAALQPPTDEMILGRDLTRGLRQMDASLKRGKTNPREVRRLLQRLAASEGPFPMHTRGGGFPLQVSSAFTSGVSLLNQLRNALYLPVEAEPAWIPPDHRYFDEHLWPGGMGGGGHAYKKDGKLATIQSAMVNDHQASTFAGVYILVKTGAVLEGKVTQITFDPEIDWVGREYFDADFVWRSKIDGTVWFTNRIWVVVTELNPVTSQFEPLVGGSAVARVAFQTPWYITASGVSAHSGSFRNGAAAFRFIASPNRTYLMGVLTDMRVSHDLHTVDGTPIPPPKDGDFVAYGLSLVSVPAMWVTHQVLSP